MLIRLNVLPYNKYNLIFHKNRLKLFIIKIRVIINLICLFFFYKGYYLYYSSLEKCKNGLDICSLKFSWIKNKLREGIYSSFIFIILIELIILKILAKFHLFHIIILFISFYLYSHGITFEDHGFFNFFGFICIIFIGLLFLVPFNIFICLIKRKKQYFIIICFIFIIFQIFFVYNYISTYLNCKDWATGLNNTSIDNNNEKHGCKIIFPKICLYKLGKYFLDVTKIQKFECGKTNLKSKLLFYSRSPYINENTTRFGYPLTNKDPFYLLDFKQPQRIGEGPFFQKILDNIIDMDNEKLLKEKFKNEIPEMIVDFSKNQNGEIKINLNYNTSLAQIRKNEESKVKPYSDNIIVIYIDSVSRANSLRQLKKSMKFFEIFMNYKGKFHPKYPNETYHSFQFFKYHSFNGYTTGNYIKIFYGNDRGKHIKRITKYFKENGYITGLTIDSCQRDLIRTNHRMKLEEVCDHEMIICDPNIMHFSSIKKRCLYDKLSIDYQFEYGKQFYQKYKDNRKFLSILDCGGHEGTLEVLKYQDDVIYKFLNNLYSNNLLKDTTIFLLSDHGVGMPSLYYFIDFYKIEKHLPMLYIMINDRKNTSYKKQYQYIFENQQTFITAYDIFNTFGNILFGDKYKSIKSKNRKIYDTPKTRKGISLLMKINSKKRSPLQYPKRMSDKVCVKKSKR